MESTGRCVALAEPYPTYIVANKYRKCGDSSEVRQLARDVIRWECRPYPTIEPTPLAYLLKCRPSCIAALPLFKYCHFFKVIVAFILPARRYTSAALAMAASLCLSQVGVLSKRINESRWVSAWDLSLPIIYCILR